MCYPCTRHSLTIWMCLSYHRWCATILAAMQWTPTFPLVSPQANHWRLWDSFSTHSHFRISRDFSLPYLTRCTAWYRLLASKRFHPPFHTCQSHSDQSVEGRAVRFSWDISADNARPTNPSAVRFATAQYEKFELAGARGAGTEFGRLQREIGHL